jgi:Ca2+:H+ antiporter
VLVSLFISPEPLFLSFPQAQTGALFFAVLIGMVVVADGKSNWFKGIQLIIVYLIIALLFFFMPELM